MVKITIIILKLLLQIAIRMLKIMFSIPVIVSILILKKGDKDGKRMKKIWYK